MPLRLPFGCSEGVVVAGTAHDVADRRVGVIVGSVAECTASRPNLRWLERRM